ncbi:formiminotetrahydrofolate cyclodeaminase [Hamadaea flava]|uniref:Cyclodeaminase/cyclohydrolase family protein n=1 Tax=Hamadaea flava TaxID=1742688 RepID=A0ABV8LW27_9ACTN|nr:cyclodeaminase/cyclohydrolase family protein [Hamadaea flava]MCP2327668.1 formiminotetrahydrofolate cyclodeaminase [Hamadaea flava]
MQQTISEWLDDLASGEPTPGGGAAAALMAATGAALVGMVTELTIGNPRYADHETVMTAARERAAHLRRLATELADADEAAFGAVIEAYRLPKATEAEKAGRSAAIQQALGGAARVPLRLAAVAAEVVELAESILDGANVNVLSDVAVAADAARAALSSAAVNVEVNTTALTDRSMAAALDGELAGYLSAVGRADRITAAVRARIGGAAS